jgi:hypothetical protein
MREPVDTALVEDVHIYCPTCGAAQPAAAECRRCKCDLGLYVAALRERERSRVIALGLVREGAYSAAAEAASRYRAVSPDQDARRLVAVACLLAGRYDVAMDAYNEYKLTAGD